MDKIEVIESILNMNEVSSILNELNPKQNAQPFGQSNDGKYHGYSLRKLDCSNHPLIPDILKRLDISEQKLYSASIVYYPTNSENPIHPDNCYVDEFGNFIRTKDYEKTCVIFLNNTFTGGELVYPKQGCIFLPSIGTAVIAPAGGDYLHYVNKITSGERYTLVFRIN